jgi:hypothetical protein
MRTSESPLLDILGSSTPTQSLPAIPVEQMSKFAAKVQRVWEERLQKGKRRMKPVSREDFVVSVEVNPAPGLDVKKRVLDAKKLLDGGVDVINIADGPRAAVRVSNTALGLAIKHGPPLSLSNFSLSLTSLSL